MILEQSHRLSTSAMTTPQYKRRAMMTFVLKQKKRYWLQSLLHIDKRWCNLTATRECHPPLPTEITPSKACTSFRPYHWEICRKRPCPKRARAQRSPDCPRQHCPPCPPCPPCGSCPKPCSFRRTGATASECFDDDGNGKRRVLTQEEGKEKRGGEGKRYGPPTQRVNTRIVLVIVIVTHYRADAGFISPYFTLRVLS